LRLVIILKKLDGVVGLCKGKGFQGYCEDYLVKKNYWVPGNCLYCNFRHTGKYSSKLLFCQRGLKGFCYTSVMMLENGVEHA